MKIVLSVSIFIQLEQF